MRIRSLLGCALVAIFAGCAQAPKPAVAPVGRSSFRVLDDPDAQAPVKRDPAAHLVPPKLGDTRVSFIEASPRGALVGPAYPAAALAAHAGLVLVAVRITIDPAGHVSNVEPSPMGLTHSGGDVEPFLSAIRTAVQSWRFAPARWKSEVVIQNDAGALEWAYQSSEPTESITDLAFDFSETAGVSWKR